MLIMPQVLGFRVKQGKTIRYWLIATLVGINAHTSWEQHLQHSLVQHFHHFLIQSCLLEPKITVRNNKNQN